MRAAMAAAEVGDDVWGDDPGAQRLQERVAALLGKEAALFVPSGTMANQLAIRLQTRAGDAMVVHAQSHIHLWETGGAAALSGVTTRLAEAFDGMPDPGAVEALLDRDGDPHHSPATLVCLENTHNTCGGRVLPQDEVEAFCRRLRPHGVALHLDGARLWNAHVAGGLPLDALCAPFDTISVCLSKGLGAPVGSLLAGPRDLIRDAVRFRKMWGGGMRQVGILCAAGLHALDHHVERLAEDHRRARRFAIEAAGMPGIAVDLAATQTNMVYLFTTPEAFTRPADHAQDTLESRLAAAGVLVSSVGPIVRAVFHLDVEDAGLERALDAMHAATSAP
jgi:threonine aldolase